MRWIITKKGAGSFSRLPAPFLHGSILCPLDHLKDLRMMPPQNGMSADLVKLDVTENLYLGGVFPVFLFFTEDNTDACRGQKQYRKKQSHRCGITGLRRIPIARGFLALRL